MHATIPKRHRAAPPRQAEACSGLEFVGSSVVVCWCSDVTTTLMDMKQSRRPESSERASCRRNGSDGTTQMEGQSLECHEPSLHVCTPH